MVQIEAFFFVFIFGPGDKANSYSKHISIHTTGAAFAGLVVVICMMLHVILLMLSVGCGLKEENYILNGKFACLYILFCVLNEY